MRLKKQKISHLHSEASPGASPHPELKVLSHSSHKKSSFLKYTRLQKLLLFCLLILGLLYCSTCYPGGPDILTVPPQKHSLGRQWENTKPAQLKTLALLIEMYPEYELYFLERDARLLGQTGLVIADIDKDENLKRRIHFLNVSRANLDDPLLFDYLKQEGISAESLSNGKKILFIDTGFQGSIPRKIIKNFSGFENQFGTHMIVAAPADREYRNPFPSTRVFGTSFSPTYPLQDILEGAIDVVHPYARLPKSDLRSDHFFRNSQGQIIPESSITSEDRNDGEINPQKTRLYEEDLQFYLRDTTTQLLLEKLRNEWKVARTLWAKGKKQELINELERWIHNKGVQGTAMALDFMEMIHTNLVGEFTITPPEVGIPPQELNQNEQRLADHHLSLWRPRLCKTLMRGLAR